MRRIEEITAHPQVNRKKKHSPRTVDPAMRNDRAAEPEASLRL
jgi:hypothetical protein